MSKYGFRLSKPADLVKKLEREFDRFKASTLHSSSDHRYQSDHAFNFVITAWHIVDWLWRYHEVEYPGARTRYGVISFREFHSTVRAECPALNICYDLANGSKHFELRHNRDSSVSSASARVTGDGGGFRPAFRPAFKKAFTPAFGHYEEQLFLRLPSGKSVKAIEVFEAALKYWELFLKQSSE